MNRKNLFTLEGRICDFLNILLSYITFFRVLFLSLCSINFRILCANRILLVITSKIFILKWQSLCKYESALNYPQNEWPYLYIWRNWNFGLKKRPSFWSWSQKLNFLLRNRWEFFCDVNSNLSEATDQISASYYFVWGCTYFFSNSTVLLMTLIIKVIF